MLDLSLTTSVYLPAFVGFLRQRDREARPDGAEQLRSSPLRR
jgi:hypothetical protein